MRPGSRSSEAFKNEVRTEAEFVAAYAGACCGIGIQRASSRILRSRLAFWLCPRVPVHKGTKH